MGIKGLFGEIGPGKRVALSKLATENFEKTGRPLRVAIDVSIWEFQHKVVTGGVNPAIRTFYFRLLRLLSMPIQPLFIFDGPDKPSFKRDQKTVYYRDSTSSMLMRNMLELFGFPYHMAPGEGEAECALFQREGIVDAVLSEDVDTLMFGCTLTLRNWSAEGSRGSNSPTHVSIYDAKTTKEGKSGLDREGMILIALMSGGDYIQEGIPGCGIKVACEAARAGYGKSLCQLSKSDTAGLEAWKNNLAHELKTNEGRYFRIKHKALKIPEAFPNREVLGYYTHPVVSSASKVEKMKHDMVWDGGIDIPELHNFVVKTFNWTHMTGVKKFIRGLAPVLLAYRLRIRGDRRDSGYGDVILTTLEEMEIVRDICGQRTHFSTDGIHELRVEYHPADLVGLKLDAEHDNSEDYGRDGVTHIDDEDDDEIEGYASDRHALSVNGSKRGTSLYDPTMLHKVWIAHTIVKVGAPLKVEDYEKSLRKPKKSLKAKSAPKTKGGTLKGAMDKYVISKPGEKVAPKEEKVPDRVSTLQPIGISTSSKATRHKRVSAQSDTKEPVTKPTAKSKLHNKAVATSRSAPNTNPWSLSGPASQKHHPVVTKMLSQTDTAKSSSPPPFKCTQDFDLSSSYPETTPQKIDSTISITRKHQQTPSSSSSHRGESDEELEFPPLPSSVMRTRGSRKVSKPILSPSSPEIFKSILPPRKKRSISPSPKWRTEQSARGVLEPSSPEPVVRMQRDSRSRESSAELPSLGELFPTSLVGGSFNSSTKPGDKHKESDSLPQTRRVKDIGKYIMLRESLPGAWKEVSHDDMEELEQAGKGKGKGRAWRYSQIDVVNLGDD